MKKRISSYQKLKEENARLCDELHELCLRPHSQKSEALKIKYTHKTQTSYMVFFGKRHIYDTETGTIKVRQPLGIMAQIEKK